MADSHLEILSVRAVLVEELSLYKNSLSGLWHFSLLIGVCLTLKLNQ